MRARNASVLLLLILIGIFSTIPLSRASQTTIAHNVFEGVNGKITITAYVYKDSGETVPNKDFFAFKIRVHSNDDFNYATVSIYSAQGICDYWEPTAGAKGGGTISFGYWGISFPLWIPTVTVNVYGPYTNTITFEAILTFTYTWDMDFGAGFYTPEGSSLGWTIDVVVHEFCSQGILWTDTASWSGGYTPPVCCVAEGTLVTMADGATKPIEKVKKGDQVLGFWPTNGSYMVENVLDVTKGQFEVMVNINNGMLKITPLDHPIFIRNSTYEGWMRDPADIQVGWEIYNATSNGWVPVTSVTFEEGKTRGYDLVLDGYETYIANGILVMDKNGC